jgi:release factor glutamine methyltransferase
MVAGRRTVDLCTGSGVVAIAAARLGACPVSAWDICPRAIQCTRDNAAAAAVSIQTHLGSLNQAFSKRPYDLDVSNPPYVSTPSSATDEHIPAAAGPAWAWNAGPDGPLIVDQLCTAAPNLLTDGGTMRRGAFFLVAVLRPPAVLVAMVPVLHFVVMLA